MVSAVITIILGVAFFAMLAFPVFWGYAGEGKEGFNLIFKQIGGYDILTFAKGENIFLLLGQIFLILAMVFGGLMLLLALAYLFGKAAGNDRPKIRTRLIALLFASCAVVATVLLAVYAVQTKCGVENANVFACVGYGLIAAVLVSIISIFFAPNVKKSKGENSAKGLEVKVEKTMPTPVQAPARPVIQQPPVQNSQVKHIPPQQK